MSESIIEKSLAEIDRLRAENAKLREADSGWRGGDMTTTNEPQPIDEDWMLKAAADCLTYQPAMGSVVNCAHAVHTLIAERKRLMGLLAQRDSMKSAEVPRFHGTSKDNGSGESQFYGGQP